MIVTAVIKGNADEKTTWIDVMIEKTA